MSSELLIIVKEHLQDNAGLLHRPTGDGEVRQGEWNAFGDMMLMFLSSAAVGNFTGLLSVD